jgi:2-iminobutanoate/2-iminopropanoate deaminase
MIRMRRSALLRLSAVVLLAAVPSLVGAQGREVFGAPTGGTPLSTAIRVGNLVFASGALPARGANADTTIQGQTKSTLEGLNRSFAMAGTSLEHAVKCTVFLVEGADFQGMNQAYREFWTTVAPPARTTVVIKALVVPNAKLEIECIAAMPPK